MKVIIEFDCDDKLFNNCPAQEAVRVLQKLADKNTFKSESILNIDGEIVGYLEVIND